MLFYVVFIYLNNKFRFPGDSCGYEGSDITNPSKRGYVKKNSAMIVTFKTRMNH